MDIIEYGIVVIVFGFIKTIKRENLIKSLGYNLIVIWENDFYPA